MRLVDMKPPPPLPPSRLPPRTRTQLSEAEESVEDSKARILALTELVGAMESNQVGYATTLDQLYELYPGLQEEIEAEIDAHEWGV